MPEFLSSVLDILVSELTGIKPVDDVEAQNLMLRCRVQKEIKISPPGQDNCPTAY